jgi:NitT/TauT family transport system substrate-binding protein
MHPSRLDEPKMIWLLVSCLVKVICQDRQLKDLRQSRDKFFLSPDARTNALGRPSPASKASGQRVRPLESLFMIRSSFLAASATLLASSFPQRALAQGTPLNLRVAATANDTYASAYYAQDLGFFTRAGLNVDLETLNNGAAIAAAVSAGSMDIGVATPVTLANAYIHGLPLVIVAAGSISSAKAPTLVLIVAKNSGIKTAKDLEGKVVAVNALKTGSEVNFDVWLSQGGADVSSVKLIEANFSTMGLSVENGQIAAAVMTEPALTLALRQSKVEVMTDLDRAMGPEFLNSCWFAMKDFAQKNPEAIRRFQAAIYATQKWANSHQSETAPVLAKYSKMDESLVRTIARASYAERMRLSDIQMFLDPAAKFGIIAKPVSAASLVYQP